MFANFLLLSLVSPLLLTLPEPLTSPNNTTNCSPFLTPLPPSKQFVLLLNIVIALLRLVYFVDPRGWEGIYTPILYEFLLNLAWCLILAQWLLVILRWRDLKDYIGAPIRVLPLSLSLPLSLFLSFAFSL
jgi:hypothetical protein